ncbi:MAG: ABC transporter ATP-binding protein, partial [Halanaerobiales bacterium]|nr:ABC transporter ATP-binding protein [Halanaerobiales bacterium]
MSRKKNNKTIIEVNNLTKKYKNLTAVDNVTFKVNENEIFAFLGPNGAGKTTTINMLTGLSKITSGERYINGKKNKTDIQKDIGVVASESNLYPELSGFENLIFAASLYGINKSEREKRAEELLNKFGLIDAADRKFEAYSKGMKRKLTIAAAIIHKPKILFLDEPTTGIDVASARQIRNLIEKLNNDGTTIFLTTHYIEEAERLSDRVAFLVEGKIKHIDKIENLLNNKAKNVLELSTGRGCLKKVESIRNEFSDQNIEFFSDKIRIQIKNQENIRKYVDALDELG